MNLGLSGKCALVTGASKRLGKAIAKELAGEGAHESDVIAGFLIFTGRGSPISGIVRVVAGRRCGLRRATAFRQGRQFASARRYQHLRRLV
jgi:hypothetical protein